MPSIISPRVEELSDQTAELKVASTDSYQVVTSIKYDDCSLLQEGSQKSSAPSRLLELPWELRRLILVYSVANLYPRQLIDTKMIGEHSGQYRRKFSFCENLPPHTWEYRDGEPSPEPGALRSCQQLRREYIQVLLSERPFFCEHFLGYRTRFLPKWYKENVEIIVMGHLQPLLDDNKRDFTGSRILKSYVRPDGQWCSGHRFYSLLTDPAYLSLFPRLREFRIRWHATQLYPATPSACQWRDFVDRSGIEDYLHTRLLRKLERVKASSQTYKIVGECVYYITCRWRKWRRRISYRRNWTLCVHASITVDSLSQHQTIVTYSDSFQKI